MTIVWDINIGHILTFGTMVIGGWLLVGSMRRDIAILQQEMKSMQKAMERVGDALTIVARQDERLDTLAAQHSILDKRVYDLSHGEGMVLPMARMFPPVQK